MLEILSQNSFPCFLMLILSGVFPLSVVAYHFFQRDRRFQELKDDYEMLGVESEKFDRLEKVYYRPPRILLMSSIAQFILPTLLTILGTLIIFNPSIDFIEHQEIVIPALGYGFLGAYIYSLQLIYRRYTTLDLQPSVYFLCTVTLIAGFAFNYTASTIFAGFASTNSGPPGIEVRVFPIVAFALGYFPRLAIRWFNQIANSALGTNQTQTASLPLSVIDGISQFHETRLRDEGIDNVQNLASVKIDELLLRTRFNAQQVLEWVDQAILHSYVDQGTMQSFRRGGVRKISDFHDLWGPYHNKKTVDDSARQARAQQLQSTPDHLDALYITTANGPNMAYIENYWANVKDTVTVLRQKNIENLLTETERKLEAVRTEIFKLISQDGFDDNSRVILGGIIGELTPNPEEVASGYQENTEPELLIGLAWWLGWLTISQDHDYEFDEQACQYYLKAIKDKPEVRYELAKFYYALVKYYIDQKEDNKRALKLAENVLEFSKQDLDESELTIILKTISALIYMKTGKQDDAKKLTDEAKEIIENSPNDVPVQHSGILQEIWGELQKVPGHPEEVADILEKIEARSNMNSNDETNVDNMGNGSGSA